MLSIILLGNVLRLSAPFGEFGIEVPEFTDDPADYPEVHTTWEGIECYNHSPLLYAYGVTNVAITGKGTIAPRMDFWRTWFARPPEHMKATEHLYYWCSTNAPMARRSGTATAACSASCLNRGDVGWCSAILSVV